MLPETQIDNKDQDYFLEGSMDLVYLDHWSWMAIDIVYCIIQVNLPKPLEFIKLKLHHIQKPCPVHVPKLSSLIPL